MSSRIKSNKGGCSFPEACNSIEAQDGYHNEENDRTDFSFSNRSWADICDEDSQKTLEPEKDHASLFSNDDSTLGPTEKEVAVAATAVSVKSETLSFSFNSGSIKGVFSESSVKSEFRSDMKPVTKKRKECELILNEDSLSLTSHFDVIQMESPCKSEDMTPPKQMHCRSPIYCDEATVTSPYRLKRRVPLKESLSDENHSTDDVQPSPSKIAKKDSPAPMPIPTSHPKTPKQSTESDGNLKRKRVDSLPNTPGSGGKQRLEVETDPEVLMRRQKQIDYGKNTSGYEHYTQMVPKEQRGKEHPKTPPKQLKYSRRAWDGLIKTWRKRLHHWDPNPEHPTNLDMSEDYGSMSEVSSCDSLSMSGSLPTTPMQEWKRRVRIRRDSGSSSSSLNEDDCKPLAAEDL